MTDNITVNLPENRSYQIIVGFDILEHAGLHIKKLAPKSQVAVVTDSNIEKLHLRKLTDALKRSRIDYISIVLTPGEHTKTFHHLENLCLKLLESKIERTDVIISFGGGVVGDVVGFAAGILLRGVRVVQIPTTLVAQVDSSIGGKTAIDTKYGKNLIGLFHQPSLVITDTALLKSLPERERIAGYAEIVKYGLINDEPFFSWLERNGNNIIAGSAKIQEHAILASCRSKASIIASDEHEILEHRVLLNLGHTFAHGIEKAVDYDDCIRHGEAVAIGMMFAFELSLRMKLCPKIDVERLRKHLLSVNLPTNLDSIKHRISIESLIGAILQDKKTRNRQPVFVLVRGIGKAFLSRSVSIEDVTYILNQHLLS